MRSCFCRRKADGREARGTGCSDKTDACGCVARSRQLSGDALRFRRAEAARKSFARAISGAHSGKESLRKHCSAGGFCSGACPGGCADRSLCALRIGFLLPPAFEAAGIQRMSVMADAAPL